MKTTPLSQPVKRVLVIRIGHLGDSIMATAIIRPLQAAYGEDVLIDFASGPGVSAAILQLDQRVHRVFPIVRRRLHWRINPLKRTLNAQARRAPYDVVINLECGNECDDFARFLTYRRFYGRPVTKTQHSVERHCVDTEKSIYRDLLGVAVTGAAEPTIQPPPREERETVEVDGRFVLVNPGFAGIAKTGYRTHRGWPVEHWIELIRLMTGIPGMTVCVNGTAAERPYLEPLLQMPQVRSLVGSSIAELLDATRAAQCVISVDTGTMHLAAASGTPVIALFGPTIPGLTGPYSRTVPCKVMVSGVDCRPCSGTPLQKRCTFNRCMSELMPQSVFAALQGLLLS